MPRKKAGEKTKIYSALLRNIEKIEDKWEVKITVPELSQIDNLYLELDDEDMERFRKAATGGF